MKFDLMRKLDLVAIVLLIIMNWFLLVVIYRYDSLVTIFAKDGMYLLVRNLFIYGITIILSFMVIPRYFNYMHRRQLRIELGDTDVYPLLNYHPDDVNHQIEV